MGDQRLKSKAPSSKTGERGRTSEFKAAGDGGLLRLNAPKRFELDHRVLSKHLYDVSRSVNHGNRGITGRLVSILNRFDANEVSVYRYIGEGEKLNHVLTVRKHISKITTTTKDTHIGANGLKKRTIDDHCILVIRPPKVYSGNLKPGSFLVKEEPLEKDEVRMERIIVPLYFLGTETGMAFQRDRTKLGVIVIRGNTTVKGGNQTRDEDISTVMTLATSMSSIVSEALYYGIDPLIDIGTRNQMTMWMNNLRGRFSLIMLELDQFRNINNEKGSLEADEIMRCFVEIIRGCTRIKRKGRKGEGDFIARYTGGKIAVILPNTNIEKALEIAGRIRKAVRTGSRERQFKLLNGQDVSVTCSIGMFGSMDVVPSQRVSVAMQMTDGAETALNKAKNLGKGKESMIVCKKKEKKIDVISLLYVLKDGRLVLSTEYR